MRKFKRISGLLEALGLFLCSCGSGVTSGTSDFHGTLSQSGSEIVQGDFEIDFDQGRVTGTGSVLFPEQDEIEGVIDGTFTESDNGDKSGTFTLTTPAGETFTFNFTASGSGMTGNYTVSDGETGNFAAVLDSTGTAAGFYEDLFLRQDS